MSNLNGSKLSAVAAEFRPTSESSPTTSSSANMPQMPPTGPSYRAPTRPGFNNGPPGINQHPPSNWNNYSGNANTGGRFHHPTNNWNNGPSQHGSMSHHVNPMSHHGGSQHHYNNNAHSMNMNTGAHFNPMSSVQVGSIPQPTNFHTHHVHTGHSTGPSYNHPQYNSHHAGHPGSSQPLMQAPSRDQMRPAPTPPLFSSAILCFANGPTEGIKTQLCRVMEEQKDFKHIVLEDVYDDDGKLVLSRLEVLERDLVEALQSTGPQKPKGFVIENAVARTKHEIFLVDDILFRHKVRLQAIVLFNAPGVAEEAEESQDYIKHPIAFEVCAAGFIGEERLVVVEPEGPSFDGNEALARVLAAQPKAFEFSADILPMPLDAKSLGGPLSGAPANALSLVCDAKLNFQILRSVASTLKLGDIFTSCWTSAARVLEYSFFTRRSHYLRSFFATPLIDGERVAVVGYGRNVYIVLSAAGVCYRVDSDSLPPNFLRLIAACTEEKPLSFIFTAVAGEGKNGAPTIFVADVLLMRGTLGTALFANERIAFLGEVLPTEYVSNGLTFAPVTYYNLQSTAALTRSVSGLLVINPGYAAPGSFERQNFVWWSSEFRSFDVRIWNGQTKTIGGEEYWVFDGLVLNGGGEERVTHSSAPSQEAPLQVLIPDARVTEEVINDGNVVEVSFFEQPNVGVATQGKGGKAAVANKVAAATNTLPPCYLRYVKRKPFATHPTSRVFADVLCGNTPKWPKDSFSRCAMHLTYLPIERHQEQTTVSEKPEFA
ncbi:Hypothetical protein, putative [Bodo saltans]|uniref:Uncharacterized protein n=1 Tax=Bodo saltans TaxID=75058 RepID=A0A0S4IM67_BODSA|nr:Hypothetical protein, putative [Bodo saltans]|eukprot:CUE72623.1 Hypothetical protein, putative [Bodo saltans]